MNKDMCVACTDGILNTRAGAIIMKVPDDFVPISNSFTEDNNSEFLKWVSLDEDIKMYPTFFKTVFTDN